MIATFTLAVAAGASPLKAAILSNYAAGIVVGNVGTATTTPEKLVESFNHGWTWMNTDGEKCRGAENAEKRRVKISLRLFAASAPLRLVL